MKFAVLTPDEFDKAYNDGIGIEGVHEYGRIVALDDGVVVAEDIIEDRLVQLAIRTAFMAGTKYPSEELATVRFLTDAKRYAFRFTVMDFEKVMTSEATS